MSDSREGVAVSRSVVGGGDGSLPAEGAMLHREYESGTQHDTLGAFEPRITAFACRYCGGVPADMAGSERLVYPANIRIVHLPCTGRLDALYVLSAFEQGADGVCVFACGTDNCHHLTGSRRAAKRVEHLKGLLAGIGLEPERLSIHHLNIGQSRDFVQIVTDLTERLRALGPGKTRRR